MFYISPPTEKTAWPVPKDEKKYHEDTRHFVCGFEKINRHRLYNANANAGDIRPGQRSEHSHPHRDNSPQTEHNADGRKNVKERCQHCNAPADNCEATEHKQVINSTGTSEQQ